jgi:hypothetical protein
MPTPQDNINQDNINILIVEWASSLLRVNNTISAHLLNVLF